jgi:hypothetical protein
VLLGGLERGLHLFGAGAEVLRQRDGGQALQRGFHRAADGAGIHHVLGRVVAAVDAREHQVGLGALQHLVVARQHAVGGRALGGVAAGAELGDHHRVGVADLVRDARLLEGGRDHPDLALGAGDSAAMASSTSSPGALMPSSLVTRMRMMTPELAATA